MRIVIHFIYFDNIKLFLFYEQNTYAKSRYNLDIVVSLECDYICM